MTRDRHFPMVFTEALWVVREASEYRWRIKPGPVGENDENVVYDCGPHYWHNRLRDKFELHPVISRIVYTENIRPVDWQLLLLEWPHVSTDNPMQIAYTRNEDAGLDFLENGSKRQTRTSIGKYLSRHWPHVRDDIRRDWAGRFTPAKYEIWETKEEIIRAVEQGPKSCMKSTSDSIPFTHADNRNLTAYFDGDKTQRVRWDRHPYCVYAPEYGWATAVRMDSGLDPIIMGRALVNKKTMTFVRSFMRGDSESDYSHSDAKLEDWLTEQGYEQEDAWQNGMKLAKVEHPNGGLMAPYIDGQTNTVEVRDNYLIIDGDAHIQCDQTDGTLEGTEDSSIGSCERCDDNVSEDENYATVGRDEDALICESCLGRFYTYARGSTSNRSMWPQGYREYWVRDGDTCTVDGTAYDTDHLPDNIIRLVDETYADIDDGDVVYVECDEEYHRTHDGDVCPCKDDGMWRLKENCWQDYETNDWYYETDEQVIPDDGQTYHQTTVDRWPTTALQETLELETEGEDE